MDGAGSINRRERPENSPYPSADDPDTITPILDGLGADAELRILAIHIASTIESTMWVVGKCRTTVAATSVYVAGILGGSGFAKTVSTLLEDLVNSVDISLKYLK